MCPPKAPKVEKIPVRAASVLPDAGDPGVRAGQRSRRRLTGSAMIFAAKRAGAPGIGAPSTSGPIGTSGL